MSKLILGIDPDSDKLGVSKYRKNVLCELINLNVIELYIHLTTFEKEALKRGEVEIHMENVKRHKAVWHAKGMNKSVAAMAAQKVGMCKQAQTGVEQMAEALNIPVVLHGVSSAWKKGIQAEQFKKITGWTARSNEDTRSAAYFGYLGCKM